jgi:hypothetical protein
VRLRDAFKRGVESVDPEEVEPGWVALRRYRWGIYVEDYGWVAYLLLIPVPTCAVAAVVSAYHGLWVQAAALLVTAWAIGMLTATQVRLSEAWLTIRVQDAELEEYNGDLVQIIKTYRVKDSGQQAE